MRWAVTSRSWGLLSAARPGPVDPATAADGGVGVFMRPPKDGRRVRVVDLSSAGAVFGLASAIVAVVGGVFGITQVWLRCTGGRSGVGGLWLGCYISWRQECRGSGFEERLPLRRLPGNSICRIVRIGPRCESLCIMQGTHGSGSA
jgi:hypothetical protein